MGVLKATGEKLENFFLKNKFRTAVTSSALTVAALYGASKVNDDLTTKNIVDSTGSAVHTAASAIGKFGCDAVEPDKGTYLDKACEYGPYDAVFK